MLTLYLNQIDLQKKIPFEIAMPVSVGDLSDKEFDDLIDRAYKSAKDGKTLSLCQFKSRLEGLN